MVVLSHQALNIYSLSKEGSLAWFGAILVSYLLGPVDQGGKEYFPKAFCLTS